MSGEQLSLCYEKPASTGGPTAADLEAFLKGKGWMSRRAIEAATGWKDRDIRELASESDYVISAPGREGYRYIFDATMDEYLTYRNARRSQARKMVAKIIRTDRIFYSRMKPAFAP